MLPPYFGSLALTTPTTEEAARRDGIKLVKGTWLRHLITRKAKHLQHDSKQFVRNQDEWERPTADLDEADLLTSRFQGEGIETHALLLDLDVEHTYLPSTQEGHGHLLVNVKLSRERWKHLMKSLALAGVIEQGYYDASMARGYASLRLPGTKKEI